jgi:hypothetical protein
MTHHKDEIVTERRMAEVEEQYAETLASRSNQAVPTNPWRRSIPGRTEACTRAMRRAYLLVRT